MTVWRMTCPELFVLQSRSTVLWEGTSLSTAFCEYCTSAIVYSKQVNMLSVLYTSVFVES